MKNLCRRTPARHSSAKDAAVRGDLAHFAHAVGAALLGLTLLVAFVPAISAAVLHGVMGAGGRLETLAALGLAILAPLPPILALEQVYSSALMRLKRARPIVYINLWRLAALLLFVLLALNLTSLPGVAIGAGVIALTLIVEALATYLYGRNSLRELAAAAH